MDSNDIELCNISVQCNILHNGALHIGRDKSVVTLHAIHETRYINDTSAHYDRAPTFIQSKEEVNILQTAKKRLQHNKAYQQVCIVVTCGLISPTIQGVITYNAIYNEFRSIVYNRIAWHISDIRN